MAGDGGVSLSGSGMNSSAFAIPPGARAAYAFAVNCPQERYLPPGTSGAMVAGNRYGLPDTIKA
jgi:hypothetical protein